MAGELLVGAVVSHEIDEHRNNPDFTKLFNHSSKSSSGGGLLSRLGRGGSSGLLSSLGAGGAAGAATGAGAGLFFGVSSHIAFGANSGPPLHIHCAAYSDLDVTQTRDRRDNTLAPTPTNFVTISATHGRTIGANSRSSTHTANDLGKSSHHQIAMGYCL